MAVTDLARRLVIPLLALIFAAVFEYSIAGLKFESRALPQILIVILALVCVYSLYRDISDWRHGRATPEDTAVAADLPTGSLRRASIVIAATVLYVLALEPVGFYIATAGFVTVAYSAFGDVTWRVIPFVAGVIAALYVLFELFLTVQLPGSF